MPVATTYPGVYIEEIPSGVRTITEITLQLHGTRFQVVQRLFQLLAEGFVELADSSVPSGHMEA